MPIFFAMQGKCLFSDISRPDLILRTDGLNQSVKQSKDTPSRDIRQHYLTVQSDIKSSLLITTISELAISDNVQ